MGICSSQNLQKSIKDKYLIQDFKLQNFLGKGGFGQVWKVVQKKTKKSYALKILDKAKMISKKSVRSILNERIILTRLLKNKCQGIINLECAFQDKKKLYILMQFIEGKTLRQILASQYVFEEAERKFITLSLAKILQSLYHNKIIHHDFKPQNIIIDQNGQPHLVDFGLSSFCFQDNSHYNGGTLEYQAPEILDSFNHTYTADYYSLGIIVYELFFKRRPYTSVSVDSLRKILKKKSFNEQNFPQLKQIDPFASQFLVRLLEKTQTKRLGYDGIQEILQHPWLKDSSQSVLINLISKNFLESTRLSKNEQTFSSKQNEKTTQMPMIKNLLQEQYVQEMFKNFDFIPLKQKRQRIQNEVINSPLIKNIESS